MTCVLSAWRVPGVIVVLAFAAVGFVSVADALLDAVSTMVGWVSHGVSWILEVSLQIYAFVGATGLPSPGSVADLRSYYDM